MGKWPREPCGARLPAKMRLSVLSTGLYGPWADSRAMVQSLVVGPMACIAVPPHGALPHEARTVLVGELPSPPAAA